MRRLSSVSAEGEWDMTAGTTDTTAAEAYEAQLVPILFAPWARRAVDLADPKPGETVLDVACGTGIGGRLVAPRIAPDGVVLCTDIDLAMVAVGRRLAENAGIPSDRLSWRVAPMEEAVADDGSMDLCLCLQGPNFAQDPAAALARIFSALRPDGRVVASVWNDFTENKGHHAIGQALIARGLKAATKPFSLGDPVEARDLIETAGFAVETFETGIETIGVSSARAFVDAVAAGAPATRHALAQLPSDAFEDFVEDVARRLDPYRTSDGVALPTSAHLVLARKPG